ncbi:MAG: hypothetical protein IID45_05865 [Planctomycetes bacterium]|nr:hypothetical protein [Planctomycetota bacterium]
MGDPNDKGKKGSTKDGKGGNSKEAGKNGKPAREKTGAQGKKRGTGTGSSSKPKAGGNKPAPMKSVKESGKPNAQNPGGNPGGPGGNSKSSAGMPGGGGNGSQSSGKGGSVTPTPAADPDVEYGRKATSLALRNLEDALKKGEYPDIFDSKEAAERFSQRMKKQQQILDKPVDPNDPRAKARLRRIEEKMRSLRDRFQSEGGILKGKNVRQQNIDGTGANSSINLPPHLKRYYNDFTKSVAPARKSNRKP